MRSRGRRKLKKPDVTAIEAQIAHVHRKSDKIENAKASTQKDLARQEDNVKKFQKDLEDVTKASALAEGKHHASRLHSLS